LVIWHGILAQVREQHPKITVDLGILAVGDIILDYLWLMAKITISFLMFLDSEDCQLPMESS
jgi:hypothetical protein